MLDEVSRRKILTLLGIGSAGGGIIAFLACTQTDDSGGSPVDRATETATPKEAGTSTPDPTVEDIRDYGATVDRETDDSGAIQRALDAAAPKGTVGIPPGTIRIDRGDEHVAAMRLTSKHRNVTLKGMGQTPSDTRLLMTPGQDRVHFGMHLNSESADVFHNIALENLTLDGNKTAQKSGPGSGIITNGSGGSISLRGCRVKSWMNAGLKLEGGLSGDIQDCQFENIGLRSNGGHSIASNQSIKGTTTTIKRTLCRNSGGVAIDVGGDGRTDMQTVNIEQCVLMNSRGSLKINPENKRTTVRNTAMLGDDSTTIPVKMNPGDRRMGEVVLENVLIDGGGWPAIDFPSRGTLKLGNVAIMNVDQNNIERGGDRGGVHTDGIKFESSGAVSIHNVGANNSGDVLKVSDGAGAIKELIYGGVGELGSVEGVELQSMTPDGDPIDPPVPTEAEVGLSAFLSSVSN